MTLHERIYKAQCYGNVEPIEHMVPYPNIPALVEGETVKFADRMLFPESGLTNGQFRSKVNQTAHWLNEKGIGHLDRIHLKPFPFPYTQILAYAIWSVGGSLVMASDEIPNASLEKCNIKETLSPYNLDIVDEIQRHSTDFTPRVKPLLAEEACILAMDNRQIQLSHYQCLINVNGIMRGMEIDDSLSYYSELEPATLPWLLFETLLPFFTGAIFSNNSPDIVINNSNSTGEGSYVLTSDWKSSFADNECFVIPEAGGVLMIGNRPIHLMNVHSSNKTISINGHGVMMGYLDETLNRKSFIDDKLVISL